MVHFNNQYIPVDEAVIDSLKILTGNNVAFDPCPYVKVGDRVRVTKGPLKGVEGLLLEKRNKNPSMVVSVDAITSSVRFVVDMDCIDSL